MSLVTLVAALAVPRPAKAEEKARFVYLRGAGADDCPAELDLRLWVMARLGYDPFSPQASRVVLARVESSGSQLLGSVEIGDAQGVSTGRRELASEPGHCQELARALALSISLAIDPERMSQAAPEAVAPSPTPTAPPTPAPPVSPASPPRESAVQAPPEPRFSAGVGFDGAAGMLPAPGLGGVVALGVRGRLGALFLEGRALQSLPNEQDPRGSIGGTLLAPGVAACRFVGAFGYCLAAELGWQRLRSSGVSDPATGSAIYAGVGPRVRWAWSIAPRLALVASFEGLVNLTRNSATLSGRDVWRAAPASVTLRLGVETHFL